MITRQLLQFIDKCPTAFHAVSAIEEILQDHGFIKLCEEESYSLHPNQKYYITRNGSSLIAFSIPAQTPTGFMICASHSDSPTFKLKPNPTLSTIGKYVRLNTERYGGMIMSSWFDRPLSVAGRITYETKEGIKTVNVNIDRDLAVIPNVAIHMNRNINSGYEYNARIDTLPLVSHLSSETSILSIISQELGIEESSVLGHDLYLYCRQPGTVFGADEAFILAPRIDNLECAWSSLMGFLEADATSAIPLYAVFDNEETGSESKQGAASDFLSLTIDRILASLVSADQKGAILSRSFMLSADNAHAIHPNRPELSDAANAPHMNEGIVIKYNASQRYTTDGVSASLFKAICKKANVPTQVFANRSDMAGGSTLGTIANTKVSVKTVDIGLAQLAMHSACETAGAYDAEHMIKACRTFFSSTIEIHDNTIVLS